MTELRSDEIITRMAPATLAGSPPLGLRGIRAAPSTRVSARRWSWDTAAGQLFRRCWGRVETLAGGYAQTDEIQVYDAEINQPGQFSLQLHNNYTPVGREQPDFTGGIAPSHMLNGVPEWALGITECLELGAYAPLYSRTGTGRLLIDGAKLRAEFVVPHAAARSFFYGVNFELSFNAQYWERTRNSGEIRPIIGGRIGPVDLIVNPILDTSFQGLGSLDFAPASRLAYNLSETWAIALEHYADFGRFRRCLLSSSSFSRWPIIRAAR